MSVLSARWRGVVGLAVLMIVAACESTTDPQGNATVRVLLTDAPSDYIATAEIWISRVYLVPGEDEEGGPVDLFNDPDNPLTYDLLELRDGITADLTGDVIVEPGQYSQLRLIVDSSRVTLIEGTEFNDGATEKTLFVPSGMQTGIKVNLESPIEAEAGSLTELIVDFDVDQNFVIQGNPETAAGIHGILFKPVLHEQSRAETD